MEVERDLVSLEQEEKEINEEKYVDEILNMLDSINEDYEDDNDCDDFDDYSEYENMVDEWGASMPTQTKSKKITRQPKKEMKEAVEVEPVQTQAPMRYLAGQALCCVPIELVVCPKCTNCAKVISGSYDNKVTCRHCGYYNAKANIHNMELFLTTRFLGNILWARNVAHLDFLEKFVTDLATSRSHLKCHRGSNQSMVSRLPWFFRSDAKRGKLLEKLKVLRKKAESADP